MEHENGTVPVIPVGAITPQQPASDTAKNVEPGAAGASLRTGAAERADGAHADNGNRGAEAPSAPASDPARTTGPAAGGAKDAQSTKTLAIVCCIALAAGLLGGVLGGIAVSATEVGGNTGSTQAGAMGGPSGNQGMDGMSPDGGDGGSSPSMPSGGAGGQEPDLADGAEDAGGSDESSQTDADAQALISNDGGIDA